MPKSHENENESSLFAARFPPRNPEAERVFALRQSNLPEAERKSDASNPYLVQKRLESRDEMQRMKQQYGEK